MHPFQQMALLTKNPSKAMLFSLGLYKMCRSIKGETKGTDTQLSSCLSAESWKLRVKIVNLNSLTRT